MEKTFATRRVALALLAHPDDAEILCGGTLIRLREQCGFEVHIATATAGDCGSSTLPPNEISAIRRAEGQQAAELIGASYHCLEEMDVNVIFNHQANRKVIDLFRRISPTLVLTHPRHDYILDHEQTHLLARSAAFSFPIPNASDVPFAKADKRASDQLSGDELPGPGELPGVPHLYYVDPMEGRDPYSGQVVDATTCIDITNDMDRKAAMLACHASQRDWLREHHGMDEYLDAMKRHSAMRGRAIGVDFAEAFVLHRGHAFPQNDWLAELLPSNTDRNTQ